MQYGAIGLMSGSSLDGLDIAYVRFQEQAGKWDYEILQADCYPYSEEWVEKLRSAIELPAREYQLLHTAYGHYTGKEVNRFMEAHGLQYQVAVIGSHGHTTFHMPEKKMTGQLGDGAAIAAVTGLPVVSDLRAMDIALGGQGAPIVPIGEKMLLGDYEYFLNLGGIANLSAKPDSHRDQTPNPKPETANPSNLVAFDVCPANRVLNMLSAELGMEYDKDGAVAASGKVHTGLIEELNQLEYYKLPNPKSLANDFGTDVVYPIIQQAGIPVADALRSYCEHIVEQVCGSLRSLRTPERPAAKMLVTGGGALNGFLTSLLRERLAVLGVELVVPDTKLVNFKEAMVMAFMAVLRWRHSTNVLASVTGASRDSIGGALWMGQEA